MRSCAWTPAAPRGKSWPVETSAHRTQRVARWTPKAGSHKRRQTTSCINTGYRFISIQRIHKSLPSHPHQGAATEGVQRLAQRSTCPLPCASGALPSPDVRISVLQCPPSGGSSRPAGRTPAQTWCLVALLQALPGGWLLHSPPGWCLLDRPLARAVAAGMRGKGLFIWAAPANLPPLWLQEGRWQCSISLRDAGMEGKIATARWGRGGERNDPGFSGKIPASVTEQPQGEEWGGALIPQQG